jgi:hypothetical protein
MEEDKKFCKLAIPNAEQSNFRETLKKIPNGEYEVEQLKDGKKILINKPGKKGLNDFRVDLYDPKNDSRKSLKHEEIYNDITNKYENNPKETEKMLQGLLEVCKGQEPDKVISEKKIKNTSGLPVDTILKNYKWIWGQEDCNYPKGKGRWLSMDAFLEDFEIPNKK